MIPIDITIHYDALTLLISDKSNLLEEAKNTFYQTDYYDEILIEEMNHMYEDFIELYDEHIDEISFVDYIQLSSQNPCYNYSETRECSLGTIAFDIPCEFDDEAFTKRLLELDELKKLNNVEEEIEM